jgi:hypothetical protein
MSDRKVFHGGVTPLPDQPGLRTAGLPIEPVLFTVACVLCAIPVWVPDFPPMTDLPQHAAQVALLFNLANPEFQFADLFKVNLFTPYLFGYGLIAVFFPVLGIVAACKLVISLAIAAFPPATRFFLREIGSSPCFAWLVFPTLYGFSYQWGFLNFLVAAPVGMFFLGLVWRRNSEPTLGSSLLMAGALNLLFFCHALIFGFFVIIAVAYWLFRARRSRDFIALAWPVLTTIPAVIAWIILNRSHPAATTTTTFWDLSWFNSIDPYYSSIAAWRNSREPGWGWGRITGIIPRLLGARPDLPSLIVGLSLFAIPILAGGRFARSIPRLIPFAVCLCILLFIPSFVFGTGFVFHRFTLFMLPFFLAALDFSTQEEIVAHRKWLWPAIPVIAFSWMALMINRTLLIDKQMEGFATILDRMEPGKRTLSMIFARDDPASISPTFIHFPTWYSALKQGITDPSAASFLQMPVAFRSGKMPRAAIMGFDWNPQWFDWREYNADRYDYFIVRSESDMTGQLFRDAPAGLILLNHAGDWYLYGHNP